MGEVASVRELVEMEGGHRGDWGWWPKFYRWQRGRLGEKSKSGESIAQRSQRPQRGFGVVAKILSVSSVGVWAGN